MSAEKTGGPIVFEREVDLDAIIARRKAGGSPDAGASGDDDSAGGSGAGIGTLDLGDDDGAGDGGDAGGSGAGAGPDGGSGSGGQGGSGSGDSGGSDDDTDSDLDGEGIVDLSKKKPDDAGSDDNGGDGKSGDGKTAEGKPLDYLEINGHKLTADETISELQRLSSIEQAIIEDEWLSGFIKNYAKGVDPLKYIEATRVDYEKIPDMDLLREEFSKSLEGEPAGVIEKAWKKHLKREFGYDIETGKFTGEDDDDAALNEATLRREAKKLRNKRVEDQKQFITKAKDAKPAGEPARDTAAIKKAVEEHPQTKEFSGSGMLVVDVGEAGKFAIKAPDAKDVVSSASDASKIFAKFGLGPNGEVTEKTDLAKLFKALVMADNPSVYEQKLIAIGRTLQKREAYKASRQLDSGAGASGRVAGGDPEKNEKRELLKAFRDHGKHITIG